MTPTFKLGVFLLLGFMSRIVFSQTSSPPPADGSLVPYVSFSGTQYTLREFNGTYVAVLIDDEQTAAAGEAFVRWQIDRYDQLYSALKDFLGFEPAGSGLLRIAVLPQGQAGDGIIGGKGCEVTHLFFDDPNQLGRDLLYEAVKHEMVHNFDRYSTYIFTAPDPFHSWTDFMQPYLGYFLREGFTDQSLVAPDDWLRIIADRFFGPYMSFPNHSWTACIQSHSCDGTDMAQHAQGGVPLRVAQAYGPKAMTSWYGETAHLIASRNLLPNTMSNGDKVDFLFETLSNTVGENLACFADSIQWPISDAARARLGVLPPSAYCSDLDHDGDSVLQGDFNDQNPAVYPGAPEIADGLDNDLNGAADEVLVAETTPFPNGIGNALLVPWPVRIVGSLTSNPPDNWNFFKVNVSTTTNLRFQLKSTGGFNGTIQLYNPDGSSYSAEYVSDLSAITDLTVTFTPGTWRFSVSFGASGGPGTYELVIAPAAARIDPLLFAGLPISQPGGQIRLSAADVPSGLLPGSDEARFWVSGRGWVGSSPVPLSGIPYFDWTPPPGADLSRTRYGIQYFKDGLRASAMSPGIPLSSSMCTFTVQPQSVNAPASGGSAKLSVAANDGCSWQGSTESPWIQLARDTGPLPSNDGSGTGLGWGSGAGSITVYMSANTGSAARTGSINVAGRTVGVNQSAPAVGLSNAQVQFSWTVGGPAPGPQMVNVGNGGGTGDLAWSASPGMPWILVSPRAGTVLSTPALGLSVDTTAKQIQVPGSYSGSVVITSALGTSTVISVSLAVVAPTLSTVRISTVSNAASGAPTIESGSWVSIYGINLSATTRTWQTADFAGNNLPTTLDHVSVTINGKSAAIYYVSPGQLNVLAPTDSVTGPVPVQVTSSYGTASATATLQRYSPALFPQGRYAAAVHTDGVYVAPPGYFGSSVASRQAQPGEIFLLFGTGFGPTSPAVDAGEIFSGAAPLSDPSQLQISIGGVSALVQFAGIVVAGEYQFNVVVPLLPDGDQPVVATIGGANTETGLSIAIKN